MKNLIMHVFILVHGIIDLSLLGSKIHNLNDYDFNGCKCAFFNLDNCNKEKAISFSHNQLYLQIK